MLKGSWTHISKLAIDPLVHSELLADLRTATANEEMLLEKTKESIYDLLDSLRLAMYFII
jgi:hypothetical protein